MESMKHIKFSDVKASIIAALNQHHPTFTDEPTGVTLIDGFTYVPIQPEFTNNIELVGARLPMIMLVGNSTGRVYFVAAKKLLPKFGEELEDGAKSE